MARLAEEPHTETLAKLETRRLIYIAGQLHGGRSKEIVGQTVIESSISSIGFASIVCSRRNRVCLFPFSGSGCFSTIVLESIIRCVRSLR
jgi:hypothetical protein